MGYFDATFGSTVQKRRAALLLCAAMLLWLFAFASHVHAHDEAAPHGKAPSSCTFCLSLPAGAPAPAVAQAMPAVSAPVAPESPRHLRAGRDAGASYLIRGPPAI
jgi:hypothetical protein